MTSGARRRGATARAERPAAVLARLDLDDASRRRRLDFLELGPGDEANLAELRAFAHANVDAIVDDFYRHLSAFEETRALLGDAAHVAHLKTLQRAYFLRMVDGTLDRDYFESRWRVGAEHARIDLRPEWYLGTYALYLRLLAARLREHHRGDPERLLDLLESFAKVMFLDMGLAIDAYITSGYVDRRLALEYRHMTEMAERALAAKTELERTKADLTGMIVHDLKGPLGGILAVTQLALRGAGASAPNARQFAQIQRSARDLMRMIENLLEIDQMREGRLELRLEPVHVAALLTDCAEEYRAAAEMARMQITVAADEALPMVVTDRWLLRRVLNNLVVNAIRHSAAGRVDLAARVAGQRVEIRVHDTGRGIAVADQAALLTRERREAGPRGAHRDDTGLGLVFCRMAIERMGGALTIESAPGAGATFLVTLPIEATA